MEQEVRGHKERWESWRFVWVARTSQY